MRYRFAKSADLETLRSMLPLGFLATSHVQDELVGLWRTMSANGEARITVIEDPELPQPQAIQAVGASVFVREDFAQEFSRDPRPYLPGEIYERVLAGRSPVLSQREIREANSGSGLNLVMLHFALRNPDLMDPQVQQVMGAVNAAFFFFYGGYHLNTILQEVYGRQHADYMEAGGFRVLDDFGAYFANGHAAPIPALHPYLFRMRNEDVQPSAVNPLSFLFHAQRPPIHFSPAEQKVLERALLNESDLEISEDFGITLDAVKKTWRRVYHRTAREAPHLIAGSDASNSPDARGNEKRRHLLEYLRLHLEELRPHERPASR